MFCNKDSEVSGLKIQGANVFVLALLKKDLIL